ncbi:MAG: GNAT family N-acetyltransferase [Candidatus Micrarchaeota archaeon]
MTNKITIRKATLVDVPLLLENWKKLMRLNAQVHRIYRLKKKHTDFYPPFIRKILKTRKAVVFIAEIDGKCAGHILVELKTLPKCYVIKLEAYISELFVKKEYRRKGIATRLLAEAEKWGKKKHAAQFGLTVNVQNKNAQACYSKFGLQVQRFKMIKEI